MSSPNPVISFNGVDQTLSITPPDVGGFAGDTCIAAVNNQGFYSFTKNSLNFSYKTNSQFWSPTSTTSPFDPRSIYDYVSQRWFTVEVDNSQSSNSNILISVSNSMDYSQGSNSFSILFDNTGTTWADYPQIGYNPNYVVISVNAFNISNNASVGSVIYVLNKSALLSETLSYQKIVDPSNVNQCPMVSYDNTTPFYLARVVPGLLGINSNTALARITGTIGSLNYIPNFTTALSLVTWASTGNNAPQSGSSNLIDTNDDRIQNAVLYNGILWYTHTIFETLTSVSQVQWWSFNLGLLVLLSNQVISSPSNFYCYPSIAVNKNGDAVIVFAQMNSTIFPTMLYSYKDNTDSSFRSPVVIKSGSSAYNNLRWGDYFTASVDPSDLESFWIQGEVTDSFNNWLTWIARIRPLTYLTVPKSDYFRQLRTQIGTFNSGNWNFNGYPSWVLGNPGDIIVSGKVYSGSDDSLVTWTPGSATFNIINTVVQPYTPYSFQWGISSDFPLSADIFGSGVSLLCVWRFGIWFFTDIYNMELYTYIFGTTGDVPIVGDWLNLKRKQIGVWRPSNARFYFLDVVTGLQGSYQYGIPYPSSSNDIPLTGDFFGLGYDQFGIFRSSTGVWYIQNYVNQSQFASYQWGQNGDIPLEGDFNGDGIQDIAVYRPNNQTFYVRNIEGLIYGVSGDIPVPGTDVYNRMHALGLV